LPAEIGDQDHKIFRRRPKSITRVLNMHPFEGRVRKRLSAPRDMMSAMKLDVLPAKDPWYADGLKFTCTQCGNCCTGGPGFVWISDEEVERLAEYLKLTAREVRSKYCRKVGGRWSLNESRTRDGNYDCVFLTTIENAPRKTSELAPGETIPLKRRGCSIYPVRPLQCRTWPFWHSNLEDEEMWKHAGKKCPGLNRGTRTFTQQQIESLRDATDWPQNPPGSK
jgi:Fe-S-cluster containining protein